MVLAQLAPHLIWKYQPRSLDELITGCPRGRIT